MSEKRSSFFALVQGEDEIATKNGELNAQTKTFAHPVGKAFPLRLRFSDDENGLNSASGKLKNRVLKSLKKLNKGE